MTRGAEGPAVAGNVRMIAQRIDPETRLTEVLVSIPPDAVMPLDAYVRGELTLAGVDGLVVPRSAVLPADVGFSIFTIDQGKAVEHKVSIVAEDDQSAEITGDGFGNGRGGGDGGEHGIGKRHVGEVGRRHGSIRRRSRPPRRPRSESRSLGQPARGPFCFFWWHWLPGAYLPRGRSRSRFSRTSIFR